MISCLLESVRHPMLILDSKLRVESANLRFYHDFGLLPEHVEGHRFFDLQGGAWDLPGLPALLTAVLMEGTPLEELERTVELPSQGRRALLFHGRRADRAAPIPPLLILSIEDVTEHRPSRRGPVEAPASLEPIQGDVERNPTQLDPNRAGWLLRAVADNTADAIFVKDREGRYLLFNEAAARFVGRPVEEVIGQDDTTLFDPDSARLVQERDRQVMETGEVVAREEELTAAGTTRVYHALKAPYRDERGNVIGLIGISRDITERMRAEEALRVSEERFRAFMDNCPAAAFVKDDRGRFLYVNSAWRRQFEQEPVEWLGKTDFDFWPREVAELFRKSDRECLEKDIPLQIEERGQRPGEREARTWMVLKFPLGGERERRVGGMAWDVTDRTRAEEALRLRDRAIRAVTQGIIITDPNLPDNPILYASPSFEQVTGYSPDEIVGRNCRFLHGRDTDPEAVTHLRDAIAAGVPCTVELLNYKKDGSPFWNELSISPVRDDNDALSHWVGVLTDVTGRRQLQAQLLQAQKMEGIGRLAGGIAHDFNNMLAVINGYSMLMLGSIPDEHPLRGFIEEIGRAGDRAAGLTRQLLAFSRRQLIELKVLDLNDVIVGVETLLRRLIGEDIELRTVGSPEPLLVRADAAQLEQVIVNLAVNARDAMPAGGSLTLAVKGVHVDASAMDPEMEADPGDYVMLSVQDTGVGIEAEHLAHLFEPFFTTKEIGKGTGLGLSMVYGVVRQGGGFIRVESEPGRGACFFVYLPRVAAGRLPRPDRPDGDYTVS